MDHTVRSGREAFLFSREEVGRKIPLVNYFNFGIGATVIPLTSAGFFKGFGYRTTLDKLGVVYGINAVAPQSSCQEQMGKRCSDTGQALLSA